MTGFARTLAQIVPINNLGELRWYAGCHYFRDKVAGLLATLQKYFTERIVEQFVVTAGRNPALPTDVFLEEFDEDEPGGVRPFRELVGNRCGLQT